MYDIIGVIGVIGGINQFVIMIVSFFLIPYSEISFKFQTLKKLYLYDSKKFLKRLDKANKLMQLTSLTSNAKVD